MNRKCLKTLFVATGIFLLLYALNHFMPLHRDDYEYSLVWLTNRHITSFSDVIESLQRHYLLHGGRMVAFFFLDVFLLIGKDLFDVVNALMFLFFVILLTIHAGRDLAFWQEPGLFAVVGILTWLSLPHFGEVAVWKCGSTVYLWTGVFAALFLLPYNLYLKELQKGRKKLRNWLFLPMFLLGLLAGCSVENLAVTVFLLTSWLSFTAFGKKALPLWMPSGAFGALLGLLLLVAAPGNFVRYDAQGSGKGIFTHIGNQFAANGEMVLYLLPVLLLFLVARRIYRLHLTECVDSVEQTADFQRRFDLVRGLLLAFILLLVVSYFNESFAANALRDWLIAHVLYPLGLDKPRTIEHFANVMAGFEEMAIYWLSIFFFYSLLKRALGFSAKQLAALRAVPQRLVLQTFVSARYGAFLLLLAFFNNFVMIAAPTFPARATFSSVAMILVAAGAILRDALVWDFLQKRAQNVLFCAAAAISAFTVISALYITARMQEENALRLIIVEQATANGEEIAYMKPIELKNRALRHVFFVDFDNGVTKGGLCQYYGIKDIVVE